MRNIKLTLQYDGGGYHGWQRQENAVTVQETVENAIYGCTGEQVSLIGCGRTDSGVHAKAYVCNFKTNSGIPAEKFSRAINAHLPKEGICCYLAEDAEENFHAKKSAKKKRYTYYIQNSDFPDVFLKPYSWHFRPALELSQMQRAAGAFLGTHDFIGFASSGFSVKTTVRTIYELNVFRNGSQIVIDTIGNGFLYNMVRIIAGTLVFAGCGKLRAEDMPEIIASCDRNRAGITAPPEGLFLSEVYYEE